MPAELLRAHANGEPASAEVLSLIEHQGWGHFTAMQVRGGGTRGLDFHLARLTTAHQELYGRSLASELVRGQVREALDGISDASVRVYGYWAGLIVIVRPPADMPRRPHTLASIHFQRPLARLKHAGSWGQGVLPDEPGADEVLLVDETGRISEGGVTNVGCWRDGTVVWPDGPHLDGVTMQVLQRELARRGVRQSAGTVRLSDLPDYQGMLICNSRGWAPVSQVDQTPIPVDPALTNAIGTAFDGCPLDVI
jgi:branched-subunit amino acid aminotransferase/4-amino-4-deoxychorismate lyase